LRYTTFRRGLRRVVALGTDEQSSRITTWNCRREDFLSATKL